MPPKGSKENLIRVRVDDRLKRDAEQMAEDRGESLSVILRHLLRDAIRDWRQEVTDAIENDPAHIAHKAQQLLDAAAAAEHQQSPRPTRYQIDPTPESDFRLNDHPETPGED